MTALAYPEPYKLPAGLLAVLVHALFFVLHYVGFNWHATQPESVRVELWSSLPDAQVEAPLAAPQAPAPMPAPKVVERTAPPAKMPAPVVPHKADIEVRDKKSKPVEKKKVEQAKPSKADMRRQEAAEFAAQEEERIQAARKRMRAELDEAMAGEVGRYQDMIRAKIRRNITMPPDVPDSAQVEFDVTLLPGGEVGMVTRTRSSGHAAYDSAVERAIYKSKTLPVPADPAMARMFRELHLKFKPKE